MNQHEITAKRLRRIAASSSRAAGYEATKKEPQRGAFHVMIKMRGTYQNNYPGAADYTNGYIANAVNAALETFEGYIDGKVEITTVSINQDVEHSIVPGAIA